ncbi:MAG: 4Fe-4S ferredoxin [Candidatus Altiarchaeales archaeon]|nr:MAG: 4Fe-4S ferredoxin [Candidatus Altiarchaeales archaeon]RLI94090.1 MAG: 4Fe-4S ferredoxin [Candidatus Altiarchaeales archaeon]HDO82633.1 4Fe-4S dicluster domain-containing protein [Candidatus Altiarchaeales archaeon]HEX55282.1 4Fe-4S dicluster domain-containing protein [Candidatus Altiarchaeales archaeon]
MVSINHNKCLYCGGCIGICPSNAIELKEVRIHIDNDKCINCNNCIKFCPTGALF